MSRTRSITYDCDKNYPSTRYAGTVSSLRYAERPTAFGAWWEARGYLAKHPPLCPENEDRAPMRIPPVTLVLQPPQYGDGAVVAGQAGRVRTTRAA